MKYHLSTVIEFQNEFIWQVIKLVTFHLSYSLVKAFIKQLKKYFLHLLGYYSIKSCCINIKLNGYFHLFNVSVKKTIFCCSAALYIIYLLIPHIFFHFEVDYNTIELKMDLTKTKVKYTYLVSSI